MMPKSRAIVLYCAPIVSRGSFFFYLGNLGTTHERLPSRPLRYLALAYSSSARLGWFAKTLLDLFRKRIR